MAYIKAISYYLPEKVLTNEELIKEFPEWSVEKVAKKVGVNSRHIADEKETAGDLAEKAALNLFAEYKINPKDIDFLILCFPELVLIQKFSGPFTLWIAYPAQITGSPAIKTVYHNDTDYSKYSCCYHSIEQQILFHPYMQHM